MLELIRRLQAIDRRVVYLLIVLVLSIPFVVSYSLPIYPDTYTRRFFDQVERIAADPVEREKIILVLSNWGPGTSGENEPQFRVIMRHLLRRKLKFVLLCSIADPVFHDAALTSFERAMEDEIQWARKHRAELPTWVYGEDYLDFGYKNAPVFAPLARTIITEPRPFYGQDFVNRKDLTDDRSYPLLRRFQSTHDVSAVLVISAGDESRDIAGLVKSQYPHLKIAPATMGISANDLYPYVKSGQFFGLLNSARAATEYRTLLNPDEPSTQPLDNSMSMGKSLLLLLVLLGNLAYLITRRAERSGRLPPPDPRGVQPPLPPLPKAFMWMLFGVFMVFYGSTAVAEYFRYSRDHTLPRLRTPRPDDQPDRTYPRYEQVGREDLADAARADAERSPNPVLRNLVQREAELRFARLVEARVSEFIMAFLTLGVFAFLLGDNKFYRFIEAIIVGGAAAYLLDQIDQIIRPDWLTPILDGLTGRARWTGTLWLLLALPGMLWYFAYSKKRRWLNQLVVAGFIGLAIGPEFRKQIGLIIPQVLDTIQPIWPWATNLQTGATEFLPSRLEHLVFVVVVVLSLSYFIFFFRPQTRLGRGTITAGRMVMMIGFGAMFGNTVNTRLSWLAPRVGFLIEGWLGKLVAR
jgi:hypothetical protein